MVKVLWSSNAPWSPTGYGQQTKYILRGIRDLGYPVACHAWWGLEGGPTEWEGIRMFPRHLDGYGNDAMPYYCRQFRADVLITLIDLWVMDTNLGHLGNTRYCPYYPIDSADPIAPAVAERFNHAHRLIVYSKYAEREVKNYQDGKYAERVRYVPHGVDCSILKPASDEEKAAFRRKYFPDWPADAFICGQVAANKGYPARKSFPEVMEAFAMFAQNHPEARLYLHSYAESDFKGPNLQQMAAHYGITDKTRLANPRMLLASDYSDEMMREIYCSLDVLLSPSQAEGFGLPILESQSCGTSVIVNDHSAMSELVGCGWRVKPVRLFPSLLWAKLAEADPVGVHHALEECFRRPKSPHWASIAREFALQYDWKRVIVDYWAPFLAELDGGRRELALELEETRLEKAGTRA